MASPPETTSRSSCGQVSSGRTESVAGAPMRRTATRCRRRRSRTALVACVVPSMAWLMRARSMCPAARTASTAASMPELTSGVVGALALASRRSSRSRTTASVFVPPTSMPRRRSRPAGDGHRPGAAGAPVGPPDSPHADVIAGPAPGARVEVLDRHVVEVEAEGARTGGLQADAASARWAGRGRRWPRRAGRSAGAPCGWPRRSARRGGR